MIHSRAVSDFLFLFYGLGHIISIDSSIGTVCYTAVTSYTHAIFSPQLFVHRHNGLRSYLCVFNINVCVLDSLGTIRHERELSLVCTQKTIYQKFTLIWL